jgi:hypothetical protein
LTDMKACHGLNNPFYLDQIIGLGRQNFDVWILKLITKFRSS